MSPMIALSQTGIASMMDEEDIFPVEIVEETTWPFHFRQTDEECQKAVMPSDIKEEHRQQYAALGDLMKILSPQERKVIRAHFHHGLSWDEITTSLKMSIEEVRHHAVCGLGKMRRAAKQMKVS